MLQDRDLELLRTAHEYRLITTPQYLMLFAGDSRDGIYRRLQRLFHHGYLDRIGENPNAPLVYALARRGAEVLEASSRKNVGDRYVLHQLMIGNVRIALTLASRERGIVLSWRSVGEDLPVRPDGFFGLQFPDRPEGGNRAFFFLEADRSTMTRERFVEKLRRYWTWHEQGGHTAALGIRTFLVLTVTKSEARMESLLEAAASAEDLHEAWPLLWFSCEERVSAAHPSSVFAQVWQTPGDGGVLHSLLPSSGAAPLVHPPEMHGARAG